MNKSVTILSTMSLTLLLGACGSSTPRTAARPATNLKVTDSAKVHDAPSRWFVELQGDPTELSTLSVGSQQATFRAQAEQRGIHLQAVRSFQTLFNGFSVLATGSEINRVSRMPGVIGVYPVRKVSLPRTLNPLKVGVTPDMYYAKGMTGADIAQNELGLTGAGVKVGIIDSGIDLQHPAFTGRVVAQYDFVGDAYDANDPAHSVPVPDPSADDCGGHGTHVSGIVGGNDPTTGFKGTAPGVSFGAYKVFGCEGSVDNDIIVAAMERALADGMQVVNMSLGSAFDSWANGPDAKAASRLVKKGVVVVTSAGNSGEDGTYSIGSPGTGENVIAVASVGNVKSTQDAFTLTPGGVVGQILVTGIPLPTVGQKLPIAKLSTSTPATTNDGCLVGGASPYAANSMTGKAVLIRRGTCAFREKILNAQGAGASAVIIYNNQAGTISPLVAGTPPVTIPVSTVTAADGAKIDGLISGGVTVTYDYKTIVSDNPDANTLDSFSSTGMTAELELKPDLAAPGGSIRSTVPLSVRPDGYDTYSGTSMASPQVAGAAALVLQAHPTILSKDMRSLLMNTASLRFYRDDTGAVQIGVPDYVERQGAGMIDIVSAVQSTVHATPSKLSLGESATFATRSKVIVLRNTSTSAQTFTVAHVPALTLAGTTLLPTPSTTKATVSVNGTSVDGGTVQVTVPASGEAELNVLVTPPAGAPAKSQYGGYISLKSATAGNLTVPYSGFSGDYQSIQVLGNVFFGTTEVDFPLLYDPKDGSIYQDGETIPAPLTYSFTEVAPDPAQPTQTVSDQPYVFVHFAHPSRHLSFELLNASGNVVEVLGEQNYLGRNATNIDTSTSDDYNVYPWDGKLSNGTYAANGMYQLRVKVLKALGDPTNPADTETYTSQKFNVARP